MNFGQLANYILENGSANLPQTQSTVYTGLTSFLNAQFHLHVSYNFDKANP
jgi:hypothetical protein